MSFPQTVTPVQYNQCLSTINYYMRNCIELKCKRSVIRRIIAYLCLNMSKFDAVDFSERRSEEVMFLLTLSV